MSKSLGNVIDPQEVIDRFGGEAFRIWSALEGNITKGDIRCSFDRIKGNSKFLTKIWNIARFISSFPQISNNYELAPLDKMILAELNRLIEKCRLGYEEMDAHAPAEAIRRFTWSIFADHYIEAIKSRAYNQNNAFRLELQRGAWYTLHICLKVLLKLLAPICPFITDAIWLELYSDESIHTESFPEKRADWENKIVHVLPIFMDFNNTIWRYKKEKGMALSQEINVDVYAPENLKPLSQDLQAMHRIENIKFSKPYNEEVEALSKNVFIKVNKA